MTLSSQFELKDQDCEEHAEQELLIATNTSAFKTVDETWYGPNSALIEPSYDHGSAIQFRNEFSTALNSMQSATPSFYEQSSLASPPG